MSCPTVRVMDPDYLDEIALRGVLVGPWGAVTCHAWDGLETGRMEQAYHDRRRTASKVRPALPSPEDRERLDPYEPWEHLGCDRATYLATNDYPRR